MAEQNHKDIRDCGIGDGAAVRPKLKRKSESPSTISWDNLLGANTKNCKAASPSSCNCSLEYVCFWSTKKKICIKVKVSQRPTLTVLSSHFQIPFLLLCSFIFSSSISFYLLFSLLQTLGAGIKQRHMQRQHFILCRWINRLQLPKFLSLLYHCLRQWHNKPLCGVEDTWSAAKVQKCLEKKI